MRLIDGDALMPMLKFIQEAEHQIYGKESWEFASKCINAIEDAPTIEEPKKGKWIYTGEDDGNGNTYCNCSICGARESHSRQVKVRYCWNCGAKMEGE